MPSHDSFEESTLVVFQTLLVLVCPMASRNYKQEHKLNVLHDLRADGAHLQSVSTDEVVDVDGHLHW